MPRQLRSSNLDLPSLWDIDQYQVNANALIATMANDDESIMAAPETTTAVPVVWKTNPMQGDFNPGTEAGSKIFREKTKGLPDSQRLPFSKSKANEIFQHMKAREAFLGNIVRAVPIRWNANGSVKLTANILTQYHQISLEDVQRAAFGRFHEPIAPGNPIPAAPFPLKTLDPASDDDDKKLFYQRVHSNVVATNIQNCLTPSGFDDLLLQKDKFTFSNANGDIEYDGAVMLLLLFQKLDPSTIVGYDSILDELQNAKLGNYNNDVDKMLTDMEQKFSYLKSNNQAPENFRKILFAALLSGPNHSFNDFVQRLKDDVESGIGPNRNIDADTLITAARTKFDNMDKQKLWNKVDPRDAQIMALTTQLEEIKKGQGTEKPAAAAHATNGNAPKQNGRWKQEAGPECVAGTKVQKWRTVFAGPHKTDDQGKVHHWCPNHTLDGKWDGLYCTHTKERCWKAKKKPSSTNGNASEAAPPSSTNASLDLQTKLKQVMCTNLCMSSEDVDKLFNQAASSEN